MAPRCRAPRWAPRGVSVAWLRRMRKDSAAGKDRWLVLAEQYLQERRLDKAHRAFLKAEALGAEANRCGAGRWLAAMLRGDFEAGWRESDAIRLRGAPDPHRLWNGESIERKQLIVRCLHGLGDAVQMLRYASLLNAVADGVVYEMPPSLLPLATYFNGVSEAITWGEQAPSEIAPWDVEVEVTELPYLFRSTVAELPISCNYLVPPEKLVAHVAGCMGRRKTLRVGVVWAAGEWNRERSLPEDMLGDLLLLPGVEFWSLQGGAAAAEASRYRLRDAGMLCGPGLLPLAATIANLDLVLTVDTLAAHMAGAMGVGVWLLLQHAADWRWMARGEDSPWYPSMRLFRQASPGDWKGVLRAVSIELALKRV
jgi:hypothetical protein